MQHLTINASPVKDEGNIGALYCEDKPNKVHKKSHIQ